MSPTTPFIKLSLFLAAGILLGLSLAPSPEALFPLLGGALLLFVLAFIRAKKLFLKDILFGCSSFLLIFLLGLFTASIHLPQNQKGHYLHQLSPDNLQTQKLAGVRILEQLKSDDYNDKYIASLEHLDGHGVHGKILLLLPREEQHSLQVDEELLLSTKFRYLRGSFNPHQFDYSRFMANRGIFLESRLQKGNYQNLPAENSSLRGAASKLRNRITESLKFHGFEGKELSVIQALLLGQRTDLDRDLSEAYAGAGVIHILAVSGLHVGIILLMLQGFLKPLHRFKYGRPLSFLLLLLCLWGFALLAGLSPSVVRAVSMFSFVGLGMQLRRRSSVLNSLSVSFFLLLLFRPQQLLEVGFQLSYLAVLSIIMIRPILIRLWDPKQRILKYFWNLLNISLAVQAGILPLSLYYFHQVPGLFIIANLIILPFLGIILFGGFLIILLALLQLLPQFLALTYSKAISMMNSFVEWIAEQEVFIAEEIPFSLLQMLACYLLLTALISLSRSTRPRNIMLSLTALLLLQGSFFYEAYSSAGRELIIFHAGRKTLVGEKHYRKLRLFQIPLEKPVPSISDPPIGFSSALQELEPPKALGAEESLQMDSSLLKKPVLDHQKPAKEEIPGFLKDYLRGERIRTMEARPLSNAYRFGHRTLLIIDSTGIHPLNPIAADYLLLTGSPKINLERLLKHLKPKQIIADGSNYPQLVEHWRRTCRLNEIRFHYTGEDGAFRMQMK